MNLETGLNFHDGRHSYHFKNAWIYIRFAFSNHLLSFLRSLRQPPGHFEPCKIRKRAVPPIHFSSMVNISVGALATVISVITLLLTTFFHKVCENIAVQFVRTRLISKTHAPFITSNDLWLPNIISSLFKFRRYPGMVFVVIHNS